MANVTVIGAQWGDEGKGKLVDWLSNRADVVVRFQGGHNAGHTLVVGNQTYKLSLLPSGVVQGKPSAEIIRHAAENEVDMIVLGMHGKGMLDQALFGSTTERVVRRAPCPVLTVRKPEHEFVDCD